MADVGQKRPLSVPESILEDIKAIVVSADGTITPKCFAKDTLLNHLRESLKPFLEQNFDLDEVQSAIEDLRKETAADSAAGVEGVVVIPDKDANQLDVVDGVVGSVVWLLNSGRKTEALKQLQDLVYRSGFKKGQITGRVNDDVVSAFEKLIQDDIKIYVFSSLGVETQRLLLSFSNCGDLSDMFSGFFDTNSAGVGVEKESYAKIAVSTQLNPENILYITAQSNEVTAAHAAGLKTCLMTREKDEEGKDSDLKSTTVLSSFADLFPEDEILAKRICSGDGNTAGVDDNSNESDGKGTSEEAGDQDVGDESPIE